ncbi:MAG: SH3 domain-containing protein [Chloroflexi bacterium]|nr:SH3 domain-containing protein [Chloroflexota bacterium]
MRDLRQFFRAASVRIAGMVLVALVLSACNLSSGGSVATPTVPSGGGLPVVTIVSPLDNASVPVNQEVTVSVSASDAVGITRIQLFANNSIVQTVPSQTVGGDLTLNTLIDYTPTQIGTVTLQAIAYRGSTASLADEVFLNVISGGVTQVVPTSPGITFPPPITYQPPPATYDPTCRIVANTSLNVRTGPDTVYDRILVLNAGSSAPITGRTPNNSWWQIRVNFQTGWVSGQFVTIYGNCSNVSIPPIPPTPTSRIPTWTSIPPTWTLTPQMPTATSTPGRPDLVIPTITGADVLTLGPGNTPVTSLYAFTITNTGQGPTTQFSNSVSVSPPGTVQPLGVVAGLAPGESIVLTLDLTFTAAGTYTLQARADSDSQITEASEVNNLGFFTVTVNAAP